MTARRFNDTLMSWNLDWQLKLRICNYQIKSFDRTIDPLKYEVRKNEFRNIMTENNTNIGVPRVMRYLIINETHRRKWSSIAIRALSCLPINNAKQMLTFIASRCTFFASLEKKRSVTRNGIQ